MAKHTKYLLTVDSDTGAPVKLEHVGESGELTECDLSQLGGHTPVPAHQPQVVIHIHGHQPGVAGAVFGTSGPAASIVNQPSASIVNPPSASIVNQPSASIVNQPSGKAGKKPSSRKRGSKGTKRR